MYIKNVSKKKSSLSIVIDNIYFINFVYYKYLYNFIETNIRILLYKW